MEPVLEANHLTIYEIDTSDTWAWCECYFDFTGGLPDLTPGAYQVAVYDVYAGNMLPPDTTFIDSFEVVIPGVQLIQTTNSGCAADEYPENDSFGPYEPVWLETNGIPIPVIDQFRMNCLFFVHEPFLQVMSGNDELTLTWGTDSVHCTIAAVWQALLDEDTLRVALADTSEPDSCFCADALTVRFGPLPEGIFTLDFMDGRYGNPRFWNGSIVQTTVEGSNLLITWNIDQANCCLETNWQGVLNGNLFHVTVTDTGGPCDCLCPFELSAEFGPFAPGDYLLEFNAPGMAPTDSLWFSIPLNRHQIAGLMTPEFHQSECYWLTESQSANHPLKHFAIAAAYPNPFNALLTIQYHLDRPSRLKLQVINLAGQIVDNIDLGIQPAGTHPVTWQPQQLGSGIYWLILSDGYHRDARKIVLLK